MEQSTRILSLGIDIGSTTAKVVLVENEKIIFEKYQRHFSQIKETVLSLLEELRPICENASLGVSVSGSAGLGIARAGGLSFVQEVYAESKAIKLLLPDVSCAVELGGEDAKIIFFGSGIDARMNGTCAGGTGAFIDQMATLLNVTADELDELSLNYQKIYPIASRCGVFAKTDLQALLNQGASKEDIAASIYQAVVNQTIAGLAQGQKIKGKVVFLGGPLFFCKGLQARFKETLKLTEETAIFPSYARFAVAYGAALYAKETTTSYQLKELKEIIEKAEVVSDQEFLEPLFAGEEEYKAFCNRHKKASVPERELSSYTGKAYLGIDCGSTTTKLVLLSENKEILYSYYASNLGDPLSVVKEQLLKIYDQIEGRVVIAGSSVTGYGEDLMRKAYHVDFGLVETMAHYTAASHFMPDVDFIIDIGGQDMKCFRIANGAIDSIMLNEACSSGCGSFLETFAKALGHTVQEFAQKGIYAQKPVSLGSRCTVFMNSSVKQAQKDGATVEDISAGLSVSVIKNAIYKVIRTADPKEIGKRIVVQGGTFLNDAVLRAFERELGQDVIRPNIAGLMGAYGAALYAMRAKESALIGKEELKDFSVQKQSLICKGCTNSCHLTVNTFPGGEKFISGNQCEKGLGMKEAAQLPNLYEKKREYLKSFVPGERKRGTIGLPLALGMYELLPLWHTIFTALGFEVLVSPMSTRRVYEKGQFTIPSDTVCFPAKLMHGHIEELLKKKPDAIFYPSLTYNIDEKLSDNHYNCPVVAYYSELLTGAVDALGELQFFYPYLNINNQKELAKEMQASFREAYPDITKNEWKTAIKKGFEALARYKAFIKEEGEKAVSYAKEHGLRVMVLSGRPYHIDPLVGHGIDKLAVSLGFVVVSEDSICHLAPMPDMHVLNQWTYHARLYRAAMYAAKEEKTSLVQLVSFGCGVDAVTSDEIRSILEREGALYTQIKIDEITNMGAVKIRLRSLLGALEEREQGDE